MRKVLLLLLCLYFSGAQASVSVPVFVLHSYSQEYPWTKGQHQGFVQTLNADPSRTYDIVAEYLDSKRNAYSPAYADLMADYIREKYKGYQPAVIYVTDDNALLFALSHLSGIFPDVPVFFSGINDYDIKPQLDPARVTGVFEKKEIAPNLDLMRRIDPKVRDILIVGDASETYRSIAKEIKEEMVRHPEFRATYISDNRIDNLLVLLRVRKERFMFLTTLGAVKDNEGRTLPLSEMISAIVHAGRFDVFSMEDAYLYPGVLGGYVTSGLRQGQSAARMIQQYLDGTPVAAIAPVEASPNEYIFNETELVKAGLSVPGNLEGRVTLINAVPTYYETNRPAIIGMLFGLAGLLFIILATSLLVVLRKNRQIDLVKERLVRAQYIAQMGNWDWHIPENRLFWSDGIYALFGVKPGEFGASYDAFMEFVHPDDRVAVNEAVRQSLESGSPYDIDHRIVRAGGEVLFMHESGQITRDDNGKPLRMFGTVQDITERKKSEELMQQFGNLLQSSFNEIFTFDAESLQFIQVSEGAQKNLGYSFDELMQLTPPDIKPLFTRESFEQMIAPLRSGEKQLLFFETIHQRKDGSTYPVEARLQFMQKPRPLFMSIIQDITAKVQADQALREKDEHLEHIAYHDALTGLPNRALLIDRLTHSTNRADRTGTLTALLFIDLDRFKTINDSLGHIAGDALLKAAAQRLKNLIRKVDTVARFGGDEFVILLEDVQGSKDVVVVAQKVLRALESVFEIDSHRLHTSGSIGISLYPQDGRDAETLVKNADAAMYKAKEGGRNNFYFYEKALTELMTQRIWMESKLRSALEQEAMEVFYQPLVNMKSRCICGVEALLRWNDPEEGAIPPNRFVQLAEETGLIIPLGEWVIRQACMSLKRWEEQGVRLDGFAMHINLSGRQFQQKNLPQRLQGILDNTGVSPDRIVMELTESTIMESDTVGQDMLIALREVGVGIAIDDFGTGHSSLSRLKQLPISEIKIDGSFILDLTEDDEDKAIVQAILALSASLELRVVAECVEHAGQEEFLIQHGCELAQGYFYARPMPENELLRLLLDGKQIPSVS
jgi:diguanylate cyclase (GGDEF)-like protein/PAS domain S-box-containing protein